MKLGIIIAMEEEFASVANILNDKKLLNKSPIISEYSYKNLNIITIVSKIGKAHAANAVSILINKYECDTILNVGSCGGVNGANVGDIIISKDSGYWDVDVRGFGYELGQIPGCETHFTSNININELCNSIKSNPVLQGFIISGDSFVNDEQRVEEIKSMYNNILGIDMEAASIAQICNMYGIPYILVKKVSDKADSKATASFKDNIVNMEHKTANVIADILNYLSNKN